MNQRGQAAIFVALMFNVLFVFFAMAINVALVVHDKINLQNSADLAAYYVAAKQAELLNVIAHQNYQIRQSYKLLAWRYRVLGTLGLYKPVVHPARGNTSGDAVFGPATSASVCMMYKPLWDEVPPNENLCNTPNLKIPALPKVEPIAGFLGINIGISQLADKLIQQFTTQCEMKAAVNWWFAMSIYHAFRMDQRNRKQIITALARNLKGSGNGDFLDLDGQSVLEGARQTFVKNLTFANRQAFEKGGSFELYNSMSKVETKQWLVEIQTVPILIYTDTIMPDGVCQDDPRPVTSLPQLGEAKQHLRRAVAQGGFAASDLMDNWANDSFLKDSDYQFSIGFEKNPWYMTYAGVKVAAKPRQIFFPFGNGVDMTARSYAKPFGGRIGPWYKSKWDAGSQESSGSLTDELMAPRMEQGGLMNGQNDPRRLPNYSRFPGDKNGLTTNLSLNSLDGLINTTTKFDFYRNIKMDFGANADNDILAWDQATSNATSATPIRNFEIAAIAPDLFDITYYSIEANFSKNYFPRLEANKSSFNIPNDAPVRPDLGAHGKIVPTFSIQEQLQVAKDKGLQKTEAFYFIRSKFHLLTSWLPAQGGFNYDVNQAMTNFGKCSLPDDSMKFFSPGSCVAGGGRTGYSVKLISRNALFSSQHKIGGDAGPGAILNPPSGEGW